MKEMPALPPHDMVSQVVATMAVEDMYFSIVNIMYGKSRKGE